MAKSGIGLRVFRSVFGRNSGMGFGSFGVYFIGCRFRFRSAFDSYSVACEAFSEQCLRSRSLLLPSRLNSKLI
ncbi:hypothetical protein TIFTF001_003238 [Ficus carica]|uniref:Uncharacterized protein n=1 Tax=Ficus carica TaxID=3494 RepID=A0AA87ZGI5_FICCA|nr:hypothetical protein TIFTF001_003238 [Ficus carica]